MWIQLIWQKTRWAASGYFKFQISIQVTVLFKYLEQEKIDVDVVKLYNNWISDDGIIAIAEYLESRSKALFFILWNISIQT